MIVEAEILKVASAPSFTLPGDTLTVILGIGTGVGVAAGVGVGVALGVGVGVGVTVGVGLGVGTGVGVGEISTRAMNGSGFPVRVSIQTGTAGTLGLVDSAIPW